MRIDASGTVRISGILSADGNDRADSNLECGAGSGGGIRIACATLAGTGAITANGGNATYGGCGGGGRIAIFTTESAEWSGKIQAKFGVSAFGRGTPTLGTVYTTDHDLPSATLTDWHARFFGISAWSPASLKLDNSRVWFESPGVTLDVAGGVLLTNTSTLGFGFSGTPDRSHLALGGDLAAAAGSTLHVYAGLSNALDGAGALVEVGGSLTLGGSGAIIYPYSNPTNGGSVKFEVGGNVTVATGARIDAEGRGWPVDHGPGRGIYGSGGGYGGKGGNATWNVPGGGTAPGGGAYGCSNAPVLPGSGGGSHNTRFLGHGGGLIWIDATNGTFTVNGTLTVNGIGDTSDRSGGGAGGGIFLVCKTLAGSGTINANGGATPLHSGGGGGGGRVAVWLQISNHTATVTAAGGAGANQNGDPGSLVWRQLPTVPRIGTLPASAIDYFSATLNGMLVSTGTAPATVTVYWGLSDGGADAAGWGRTNVLAGVPGDGEALAFDVEALEPGTTYYYRFFAESAVGPAWAAATASFATKAPLPIMENAAAGATAVTLASATLNGVLVSTGVLQTAVSVYWGPVDGGVDPAAWAHTNHFSGFPSLGSLATNITLPAQDVYYYYTFAATNAAGAALAEPSSAFMAGHVTLTATDDIAYEKGADIAGAFTVTRPATAMSEALAVHYAVSGTAENGSDYQSLPGVVEIPAGETSAVITVEAIMDAAAEDPETVILTLLPGHYAIGTPSADTVTIYNVAPALTNLWSGTGNWSSYANWSDAMPPIVGQHVIVDGSVTLAQTTPPLASLTNNGTLTFTTTNAILHAREVSVNGTITHTVNSDANGVDGWSVDGQVWIVCSNLTVAAGKAIDVKGKGWQGGTNNIAGRGPGGGPNNGVRGNGASYGGLGGVGNGATTSLVPGPLYGINDDALLPGSGGGGGRLDNSGAAGGGYVRIDASGTVRVEGVIRADGNDRVDANSEGGGGSGGGIRIACAALAGAGVISANGGGSTWGGCGGGGRIALFTAASAEWSGKIQAKFGVSANDAGMPTLGTVYTTDNELPLATLTDWHARFFGITSWSPADLTLDGSRVWFESPGVTLNIGGPVTLTNASILGFGYAGIADHSDVSIAGDLQIAPGSTLNVFAGVSNAAGIMGAQIAVGGRLSLATNAVINPYSNPTNGGSVRFRVGGDVSLAVGAKINADGKGWQVDRGPGRGIYGSGGGYGGAGGNNDWQVPVGGIALGGGVYGSADVPTLPGSGGGSHNGWFYGIGGGLVWIEAPRGIFTLEGTITAKGASDMTDRSGAGSGGGVYVVCKTFAGGGSLDAGGGSSAMHSGGGGGGGRIAVWARQFAHTVTATVAGGVGYTQNGQPGTLVWEPVPPSGTLLLLR